MIIELLNHLGSPILAQIYYERIGPGDEKLVMGNGNELVAGPAMSMANEKGQTIRIEVGSVIEDVPLGLVVLEPHEPRVVWFIDGLGRRFCLRLWHFELPVPW